MTVDPLVLITIVSMALVTYATRVGGFALLGRFDLTDRVMAWLRYIPGAVLVSIVAPTVLPVRLFGGDAGVSGALIAGPSDALAALVAVLVAVRTKNLLLTMVAGTFAVWVFRALFGGG